MSETLHTFAALDRAGAFERLFDGVAMAAYPRFARLFGYAFRVGAGRRLAGDADRVLAEVWSPEGVEVPLEVAWVGDRFHDAATWIVAYHRGRPVGVMGVFDVRVTSPNLEINRRRAPPELDLTRTREIGRLAIHPAHRGRAQLVMVGLLREMLAHARREGITTLLTGSTRGHFRVYRRFNPTARLLDAPPLLEPEPPELTRYYESPRRISGPQVLYTFDVAGAAPWSVFRTLLRRLVRRGDAT